MSSTQHHLRIECGAHGARPRILATAVDRRHVSAEDAQAIQNRHVRLGAALLPGRTVSAPAVPHGVIVLERTVMRDHRTRGPVDKPTTDWRRPGGEVAATAAGWLTRCPEQHCATRGPVALPTTAVAAAIDSGLTSLDIRYFQRA